MPEMNEVVSGILQTLATADNAITMDIFSEAKKASEEIVREEEALITAEREVTRLRDAVSGIETAVAREVADQLADELDESSKKRFTNDLQRKGETEARLQVNYQYNNYQESLEEVEIQQKFRRVRIDKLHRDFRLACLLYESVTIGRRH